MTARKKRLWLVRTGRGNPIWRPGTYLLTTTPDPSQERGEIYNFCPKPFERITGVRFKLGGAREIQSIIINWKPPRKK